VRLGIQREDRVALYFDHHRIEAMADFSSSEVARGRIGLFREVWQNEHIRDGEIIEVEFIKRPPSVEAIKQKLLGKPLSYNQIYSIVDDIVKGRLGDIEVTYFVATGFCQVWTIKEMCYLTQAMADTGEKVKLSGTVVDIHSIGGMPGNRTTMLAAPIVASLGLTIPKTSSRAITSPSGVADTMEYLAKVDLSIHDIKNIAEKVGATLAWGGGLNMAPADDHIIHMSYPLAMEPYSKMIVSIMAKKVAMGIKYFVIEMPVGSTAKVHSMETAKQLERKFVAIGKYFGIKVKVVKLREVEPCGHGVGPALEARDVMRVLQRKENRSRTLERTALRLSAYVASMTGKFSFRRAYRLGLKVLESGEAWRKMQDIMKAQGARVKLDIDSEDLISSKVVTYDVKSTKRGYITAVDNYAITDMVRNLGAPHNKQAGLYLHKRYKDKVDHGDILFTMYAESKERIELAQQALRKVVIFEIK
jgi:AMP phosphorylase